MYAAHFAAGLAIKSRVPDTPTWAVMTAVFVPDFAWIILARAGIEPAQPPVFFDDWSHSLAMVVLYATLFALPFWRRARPVAIALWIAVFSHFLLDLPIHPKPLALYPHSWLHLGWNLWGWGAANPFGATNYWWAQLFVVTALTLVYVQGRRRLQLPANLLLASCVLLLSLHLLML